MVMENQDIRFQVEELNRRVDMLERQIAFCQAQTEIEQLMSKYQFYYAGGAEARIPAELWTADENDCSIEVGASGVYMGKLQLSTYYEKDNLPGRLNVHTLNTPYIAVAEDLRAARGIWISIGAETDAGELGAAPPQTLEAEKLLTSRTADGKRFKAEWVWQKFAVDFVKESGAWKIKHLHIYEIFRCPYDENWVTWSQKRFETDGIRLESLFTSNIPYGPERPFENLPTEGSTFHWQYTVDSAPVMEPKIPEL